MPLIRGEVLQVDRLSYEDFVYFILSEEDKTTDASLKYWHRCVDLDDDGIITQQDMWYVLPCLIAHEAAAAGRLKQLTAGACNATLVQKTLCAVTEDA